MSTAAVRNGRPAVSVVMPFAGDEAAAVSALVALSKLNLRPGDELLAVDNTRTGVLAQAATAREGMRTVPATAEQSSYYARNVGASEAKNDWLLFVDADCVPVPDILERYFSEPIADDEGALAGQVSADPTQDSVFARYHRDRRHLDQERNISGGARPFAVTANLLVRYTAWRSIGGFLEGVRSGGDTEFSWRLQDAGWRLGYRPGARVLHRHRESLRSFGRVNLRYAAGRAWLRRRYPEAVPPDPPALDAGRALLASARWGMVGQGERARFRAIDALVIILDRVGALFANRSAGRSEISADTEVVVFVDSFPELSETFIGAELAGLANCGKPCRVEANRRASRQDLASARSFRVNYQEDDPVPVKLLTLLWLVGRHPLRACADLLARRRWRREEQVVPLRGLAPIVWRLERGGEGHLHAHFAAAAALTSMRLSSLVARPYSVTAHAYDIYWRPTNLPEKLERAAFVTTGCQYNIDHLMQVAPGADLHEVVMGVDARRFVRRRPYPGRRRILAVGRLVEKKGFRYLIDAVARLETSEPVDCLEIVGDGPLRRTLIEQVERLGIEKRTRFLGAMDHDSVRVLMEGADVFVLPCVVAADGDRDSMPVVVKEALALEVPVVTSREVGLPELVQCDWGRLVPPGDSKALAEAIREVLALDPKIRSRMGALGRRHVAEHCDVQKEAAYLARLIGQSTNIR